MDLTNLRNHQDELINHMKASGYSMSCIYMYKRQIREILELDMDSWASYKDIYQYFESVSANKKDLNWRRSVIGGIEHFDLEHLFPDRRRTCSFIEPKGACHMLILLFSFYHFELVHQPHFLIQLRLYLSHVVHILLLLSLFPLTSALPVLMSNL